MAVLNDAMDRHIQNLKSIDSKLDYIEMGRYIGVLPNGWCQDNIVIATRLLGKSFNKIFDIYEGYIVDTDGREYYHWTIGIDNKIIEITYLPWFNDDTHRYIMSKVSKRTFMEEWGYIEDDYPIDISYAKHILKTCLIGAGIITDIVCTE